MGNIIGIVCVDNRFGIGKNNDLLFHLKEDMKFFRQTTLGHVCAMGYNTLLSFPGSKPLPNRPNIVLAPADVERDDCIIVHTFEDMLSAIKKYLAEDEDVYIIGGAMFYKSMLPYYDKVYITKVDADGDAAVFFPNLDELDCFENCVDREFEENGYKLKFMTYTRVQSK